MNSIGSLYRYPPHEVRGVKALRHFAIIQDGGVVQFSAERRVASSLGVFSSAVGCFTTHLQLKTLHLNEAVVAMTFVEDTS